MLGALFLFSGDPPMATAHKSKAKSKSASKPTPSPANYPYGMTERAAKAVNTFQLAAIGIANPASITSATLTEAVFSGTSEASKGLNDPISTDPEMEAQIKWATNHLIGLAVGITHFLTPANKAESLDSAALASAREKSRFAIEQAKTKKDIATCVIPFFEELSLVLLSVVSPPTTSPL